LPAWHLTTGFYLEMGIGGRCAVTHPV
jgi:hypothetical protein